MENGFNIWSFNGKSLYRILRDHFFQFVWRPRPPSLLTAEKEEEIAKNLKKYSKKYEAGDQDASLQLSEQDREKRKALQEEWSRHFALAFATPTRSCNTTPKTREEELLKCQIHDWYPKFKPHTIKTLIHPLPPQFLSYLLDDDGPFLLPSSASGRDPLPRTATVSNPDDVSLFPPDSESDSEIDSDSASVAPSFPDFESEVENSIRALGGAAFPKLNWSSPKDAASIGVAGSLKCATFAEIALLLKSSDAIMHDLCHAFESCSDRSLEPRPQFWLALRKWYGGLRPEMEFRCFVRRRRLVGVSQREVTTFYPVLVEKKRVLCDAIEMFFDEHVAPTFGLEDYTFDVYVTGSGKVKVVDFNPWGGYTLPMLFEWEELEGEEFLGQNEEEEVEFRIVESRRGVRPGLKTAVPFDYIDTGKGSGWEQLLNKAEVELMKQVQS